MLDDDVKPGVGRAEIAGIDRADVVKVQDIGDSTQELFDSTLLLVRDELGPEPAVRGGRRSIDAHFLPNNEDLRAIFLLAEAVGGYDAFNDLVNEHSPVHLILQDFAQKARQASLSRRDLRRLTAFQEQIHNSLRNANDYLRDVAVDEFNREELHQLHEIILTASARAKELNRILGLHYIHEVERVLARLAEFHAQMQNVERSVSGIFMVDSEVMFVPTIELVECVNTIFEAVGNSYLAKNIDGVTLLAARNLLIDVSSFYSYYGKEQIYSLFKRAGGTVSTQVVTARIRGEIRRLFDACKRDNKLVLTRVMSNAERHFEISVEEIQEAATRAAVEQVKKFMPRQEVRKPPPKRSLLHKLFGWMLK